MLSPGGRLVAMNALPDQCRALRNSLGLSQWDFAALLKVSQSTITLVERGRTPIPRKAQPVFRALLAGVPASPQAGRKLVAARERLNLTPEQLALTIAVTLAALTRMEEGAETLPWSMLFRLATAERAAGFPASFDPAADPLGTLALLQSQPASTEGPQEEQADREEEAAKAAASTEAIRKEWRAKGEERRRQARENAANPEPLFDDL